MIGTSWTLTIETERLNVRPQELRDYEAWTAGFAGRLPKQHPYDAGQVDLEAWNWYLFAEVCQRHQQ